jgi:hypothetical protein
MCRPSTVIRLPARRSDSSLVAKKAPKEFGQLVTARKGHESALRSDLYLTWAETMTEADTVSRKIDELKKLQSWLGAGSRIHCSRRSNAVKFETISRKATWRCVII